jgi:hypothetical protein
MVNDAMLDSFNVVDVDSLVIVAVDSNKVLCKGPW